MSSKGRISPPLFRSEGANNFLTALRTSRTSGDARFPRFWSKENIRVKDLAEGDSQAALEQWFKRLTSDGEEKSIDECTIEENIACVASIEWKDDVLMFCRIQALITNGGNLRDFCKADDTATTAVYYRLELDADQPGPLFMEPQPHVHVVPQGAPRLLFHPPINEYLPVAFLEFIYLNHALQKWHDWAEEVCTKANPDIDFKGVKQAYELGNGILWKNRLKWQTTLDAIRFITSSEKRSKISEFPKLHTDLSIINLWPAKLS